MKRLRQFASGFVSACGIALMGMLGAPAVALLALASGVRKGTDWLCQHIEK